MKLAIKVLEVVNNDIDCENCPFVNCPCGCLVETAIHEVKEYYNEQEKLKKEVENYAEKLAQIENNGDD